MSRIAALILLALPTAALAHGGAHAVSEAPGWTLSPWVTAPLALSLAIFALGFIRLRSRSAAGRKTVERDGAKFLLGWLVLAGALVSPLHEAGERSFTMHMIEHELIMLVATLLIALSRPLATMLWAFPAPARQQLAAASRSRIVARPWQLLGNAFVATALQAAALWLWHMPALFDRALGHEAWHVAQHLCFVLTSLLFWWAMAQPRLGNHGYGVSALCLFVTSLIGGALGALMALSSSPWYAGYAAMGMTPIGLDPVADQQLAGLIMWLPGGMVHLAAALLCLYRWLQTEGGRHAVAAR
jgi:cytochrome c oxidase assembly factor CtaG